MSEKASTSNLAKICKIARIVDPRPFQANHCFTKESYREGAENIAMQRARIIMAEFGEAPEEGFFNDDLPF